MKSLLVIFLLATVNVDLKTAREFYLNAYNSKEAAIQLKDFTAAKQTACIEAYHGAALTFLAKHSFNPYKKLSYLNDGLKSLNNAVIKDSADIEIRFLRFSTEENIPSFIPFTNHTKVDKAFLLKYFNATHPFYNTIHYYIQQSKSFTKEEKAKL